MAGSSPINTNCAPAPFPLTTTSNADAATAVSHTNASKEDPCATPLTEKFKSVTLNEKQWLTQFTFLHTIGEHGYWSELALCKNSIDGLVVVKNLRLYKHLLKNWPVDEECRMHQQFSSHPYVATLQGCFSFDGRKQGSPENSRAYLALDYYPHGDLKHYKKHEKISLDKARLYLAQIVLAVEALHAQNIIHRDIKSMNVFLQNPNHVVLADFGMAIECRTITGSFTEGQDRFITDQSYVAPEILRHVASRIEPRANHQVPLYGKAVDFFALGYLLYDILFGEENTPEMASYMKTMIFNKPYPHPTMPLSKLTELEDKDAQHFIRQLVELDVQKRLGSQHGIVELKQHAFFNSIDWRSL